MKSAYTNILQLEAKWVIDDSYIVKSKKSYSAVLDNSLETDYLFSLPQSNRYEYNNKYYTEDIISIKFTFSHENMKIAQLREKIYENGFYINIGNKIIHYTRYKRSAGQARVGKCLFIKQSLYDDMIKYSFAGIDISNKTIDLASFESYISLSLSSIIDKIKINKNEILIVEDKYSKFTDRVIVSREINGELSTDIETTEIENCLFDGEGLLDKSLFTNQYRNKSMMLLRNKFFKANCLNTDIQLFFKDHYNKPTIKDMFGNLLLTKDIKLIITPSAVKYLKFGTYEQWLDNIDEYFGIVKSEHESMKLNQPDTCYLNYQITNTISLTQEKVNELLKPSLDYLHLLKNDLDILRYHLRINRLTLNEAFSSDEFIYNMISLTDEVQYTKLFKEYKSNIIKAYKNKLKHAKIPVHGNYMHLFGNPVEFLYHAINVNNQTMVSNEVYCPMFNQQTLFGARSPHVTIGNVALLRNVYHSDYKYFHITKDVAFINAINTNIQMRLNGVDYDGDELLLTDNKILINNVIPELVPTNLVNSIKLSEIRNNKNLAALDTRTSDNKIGEIINLSQKLNSIYWEKYNNNESTIDVYKDICTLANLSNIEIDRAKRVFNINSTKELSKIRKKYDQYKDPYYFKIVQNKKDKNKLYRYNCTNDILLTILEKRSKEKRVRKSITFTELFKDETIYTTDTINDTINNIIDIINKSDTRIKEIYKNNDTNKQYKYIASIEEKQQCLNELKKIDITDNLIKVLINKIDNNDNQIKPIRRRLITLLYHINTEAFNNIFKEKKQQLKKLIPSKNGNIIIFGKHYKKI